MATVLHEEVPCSSEQVLYIARSMLATETKMMRGKQTQFSRIFVNMLSHMSGKIVDELNQLQVFE